MDNRHERLRRNLSRGAVYLAAKVGIPREHYFVVLNHQPLTDSNVIMVNATTSLTPAFIAVLEKNFGPQTLVAIREGESSIVQRASMFNCNFYEHPSLEALCDSQVFPRLEYMGQIEHGILDRLVWATGTSPRMAAKYLPFFMPKD